MFSKYKYLIVILVFPTSVFGVFGNLFLVARLFPIIAYLYILVFYIILSTIYRDSSLVSAELHFVIEYLNRLYDERR